MLIPFVKTTERPHVITKDLTVGMSRLTSNVTLGAFDSRTHGGPIREVSHEFSVKTRVGSAIAVGDRSEATCRALWDSLPADYRKRAICYTDEYEVYRKVLPAARHRPSPKGSGATSLLDRCHLTLRNWCANLTRKTLAVSQLVSLHATCIRMVVDHYNSLHVGLW